MNEAGWLMLLILVFLNIVMYFTMPSMIWLPIVLLVLFGLQFILEGM